MKLTNLAQTRLRALTAVCRICGRRRVRTLLRRDIYGDEWECRSAKDCDAAVEGRAK
jgi:hypothetical protein